MSELYTTSWCTDYSSTSYDITPGYVLASNTFCVLSFVDIEYYIDFVPPVIASHTCTDTA